MHQLKEPWLTAGYSLFALKGPDHLKIERMAQQIGKNKSSFYHFFADLEIFMRHLLDHHLSQAKIIADKESNAQSRDDLISVILEHKMDLLFNRQLRIHRENQQFDACFQQVNEITIPALIPIWSAIIGLEKDMQLSEVVLRLSLENFFLQITDDTLTEGWLSQYFDTISNMVAHFKSQ